jgi:hypothetical protein
MNAYRTDRKWSDQFIPEIRRIVGEHLLVETPAAVDRTQAADLMVFSARSLTVAARVRRHVYYARYATEFTVRAERDSGARSEHEKLIDGWGDWMLYAFADAQETALCAWMLLDLNAWRAAVSRHAHGAIRLRCGQTRNGDGTGFRWYDVRSFPSEPRLVIAHEAIPIVGRAAA